MKNLKIQKNVALWFFILQFPTGTPGRFLRVGVYTRRTVASSKILNTKSGKSERDSD